MTTTEWTPPRRICLDKLTPAERAIYDAVRAVEAVGADLRLTEAVILLNQARDKVADYVDGVGVLNPRPRSGASSDPNPEGNRRE